MRQLRRFSFILIVSALLVLWATASPGPQAEQKPLSALPGNPAVPRLLLNHVTVQLKDGGVFSGYLLGVGDGTLLLKRGGKDEAVPISQMARVFIEKNSDRSAIAGMGMVVGPYLFGLAGAKAQNQPFAFTKKQYGPPASLLLLWASLGGGLGYLGGLF